VASSCLLLSVPQFDSCSLLFLWPLSRSSLRRGPCTVSSLGPWVLIPLKPWMFVRVFLCCAVLCTGRGLATGRSLIQGVLPNVYRSSQPKVAQELEERVVPSIPLSQIF
jgi:hypothetical protein